MHWIITDHDKYQCHEILRKFYTASYIAIRYAWEQAFLEASTIIKTEEIDSVVLRAIKHVWARVYLESVSIARSLDRWCAWLFPLSHLASMLWQQTCAYRGQRTDPLSWTAADLHDHRHTLPNYKRQTKDTNKYQRWNRRYQLRWYSRTNRCHWHWFESRMLDNSMVDWGHMVVYMMNLYWSVRKKR